MAIIRRGKNWFIDYRANGRRIREKIGPNRKLAESVLAKRKLDLAENDNWRRGSSTAEQSLRNWLRAFSCV